MASFVYLAIFLENFAEEQMNLSSSLYCLVLYSADERAVAVFFLAEQWDLNSYVNHTIHLHVAPIIKANEKIIRNVCRSRDAEFPLYSCC